MDRKLLLHLDVADAIRERRDDGLKIRKVTKEAIISAFSDGVRDIKMKEELAIYEDLCTSLELFNLETKCARA